MFLRSRVTASSDVEVCGMGCGTGGVPGGYYRVGIPGWVLPLPQPSIPILVLPGPNQSQDHVSAPTMALRRPSWPPPHTMAPRTQIPALEPIQARFSTKYPKVSMKSGVSPKKGDEAWHTPCFKKRSQSHDLEFSDFRYEPAFSRKE